MTEAVSLGELLHEEALLVLPTGLNGHGKNVDPMVGGATSITLFDACTPSSTLYQSCHLRWSTFR